MLETFSSADMSDIFGGGGGGLFFTSSKTSTKAVKQVLASIAVHGKITFLATVILNNREMDQHTSIFDVFIVDCFSVCEDALWSSMDKFMVRQCFGVF